MEEEENIIDMVQQYAYNGTCIKLWRVLQHTEVSYLYHIQHFWYLEFADMVKR